MAASAAVTDVIRHSGGRQTQCLQRPQSTCVDRASPSASDVILTAASPVPDSSLADLNRSGFQLSLEQPALYVYATRAKGKRLHICRIYIGCLTRSSDTCCRHILRFHARFEVTVNRITPTCTASCCCSSVSSNRDIAP
jgi:hypothetical protein